MFDDLLQVREGAKKIFQTVLQQRDKLIHNYILVPFHDPYLGKIINTTDAAYFMHQLAEVHVHGGGDCPEKTLTDFVAIVNRLDMDRVVKANWNSIVNVRRDRWTPQIWPASLIGTAFCSVD
ncbi:hypothetical protein V3C99_018525 [Haemonchus contortus]|uniref:Metallophos domain-containing protein n=1 Tax=Haemonchus contortus TaxID=6289 RepID=A0A7I5EDU7_HAECO